MLSQLERGILSVAWDNEIPIRCQKHWDMGEIFNNLEDSVQVIVPTDRTNSFWNVSTKIYMTMVNENFGIPSN